ncbi:MAG: hypothetical protein U9N77_09060 [Thermodesulfobacteriota bacterium]|nr:hypothetical protein [Thermodesulfobacteriota bacterium]
MGQAELIYEISKQLSVQVQQQLLAFAECLKMKKMDVGNPNDTLGIVQNSVPRRTPHLDIAGKTRIIGDIMNSVIESDWNLPK